MSSYKFYSTSKKAWDAMYNDIASAMRLIFWEVYIFNDDNVGSKFFDLLQKKAQEGIEVHLVLDFIGSFRVSKKRINSLKQAGVDVLFFQDKAKKLWQRVYTRTHRKILVVDSVGYIGGVNIDETMAEWLDIQIRVESRVTKSLLKSLVQMYIVAGGDKEKVKHLLKKERFIKKDLEFIFDDPNPEKSRAKDIYIKALREANRKVIFFTPYYFPDIDFWKALISARKRGINVNLLVPFTSDIGIATYVTRTYISFLKRLGVGVFFTEKMMHAKGVIVDDSWALIGSSNLDQTSFYDNYEVNALITNRNFIRNIKNVIQGWLKKAINSNSKNHKNTFVQGIKEWLSLKIYKLWHGKKRKWFDLNSKDDFEQ
jgi:cardiolipin synthase